MALVITLQLIVAQYFGQTKPDALVHAKAYQERSSWVSQYFYFSYLLAYHRQLVRSQEIS